MTLSERVRAERERQGLSQARLALLAGLSKWTVVELEGGSNPTLATIVRVVDVLGLDLTDLFLAGPDQLDVSFGLPAGVDLGPIADLEQRLLAALAEASGRLPADRLAIWPWIEPVSRGCPVVTTSTSSITVRAPASAVPVLAELAGASLAVAPRLTLAAPVVRPVAPRETLRVLITAPCPEQAGLKVRREATAAGCCPAVRIAGKRPLGPGSAWLALVLGVPAKASDVLQRLRVSGPDGLFVPI